MSNNNIEIEVKVLLKEKDYHKLAEQFKYGKKFTQVNYYIDSSNRLLKENRVALRIRHLNNEFTLTMKTPMSEGLLEKNDVLEGAVALKMIEDNVFPDCGIKEFLEMLEIDTSKLEVITKLETQRIEVKHGTGMISLDKNIYGKITDYELEVEDSSIGQAKKLATEILEENKIKVEFSEISKQARAMDEALKSHSCYRVKKEK